MARPIIYDESVRDRLRAVTAELVSAHGAEAVSLREIARKSDTSTSAIYSLFGSKEELLRDVITHAFRSFQAAQAAAESEGLRALGYAYRDWALAHPTLYKLMFSSTLSEVLPDDADAPNASRSPLEHVIARLRPGASAVQLEIEFAAIWSQVHGAVSLELAGVPLPAETWKLSYDLIVDAIANRFNL